MPTCDFNPASEEYADFILDYSSRAPETLPELVDADCVNFITREYAILHARLSEVRPISLSHYDYAFIPKIYGLLDTTALESSQILPALDNPTLRANGRGILLGIIDTGIDYTNPLFCQPDGTTRILGIWDQSIPSAEPLPPVVGFQPVYGSLYDRDAINRALASEDPFAIVPSRDTDGHGTFMAGVAAGNRIRQPFSFSGAAPEATLAVVRLKPSKQYLRDFFLIPSDVPSYQENDIMAAISYLLGLASQYIMPLVIYLGVGTNQGSHDGTSPLSLMIQSLSSVRGLSIVTGAGNEVGFHHHYMGNLTENQNFEDVELRIDPDNPGFCMELWARPPELYTVGFISPSGEVTGPLPMIPGNETLLPFRYDNTRITVSYQAYESGSGSQLIFLRFETPAPGIWHIRVYPTLALSGQFHIWLPMRDFVSADTIFLRANPDVTITDPGNGSMPLTVSTCNHTSGSIYIHSSRGFTRSGQIKPDLAAPGVEVQGPALSEQPYGPGDIPAFTRRTGSSVAAAITAGAVADILTWAYTDQNQENLTSAAVKSMLIRSAERNPDFQYPSREWGYGTLNLYRAFT